MPLDGDSLSGTVSRSLLNACMPCPSLSCAPIVSSKERREYTLSPSSTRGCCRQNSAASSRASLIAPPTQLVELRLQRIFTGACLHLISLCNYQHKHLGKDVFHDSICGNRPVSYRHTSLTDGMVSRQRPLRRILSCIPSNKNDAIQDAGSEEMGDCYST